MIQEWPSKPCRWMRRSYLHPEHARWAAWLEWLGLPFSYRPLHLPVDAYSGFRPTFLVSDSWWLHCCPAWPTDQMQVAGHLVAHDTGREFVVTSGPLFLPSPALQPASVPLWITNPYGLRLRRIFGSNGDRLVQTTMANPHWVFGRRVLEAFGFAYHAQITLPENQPASA